LTHDFPSDRIIKGQVENLPKARHVRKKNTRVENRCKRYVEKMRVGEEEGMEYVKEQ
jgi:hypothetical protein